MDAEIAFGKVLRRLRQERALTQEQLGFDADLRRTYVSVLELGEQQPSLTTILKLSKALKCTSSDLMALVEQEMHVASRKSKKTP